MKRHRTIASAPQRSTSEAWGTIAALVSDTLARSSDIERAEVDAVLGKVSGLGRMLVAGGHLEREPLVLVASELYVEIQTVSGDKALELEENLNPVPGGASADSNWKLHLPPREPLAKLIREAARRDEHLSSSAPSEPAARAAREGAGVLDEVALARWAEGGS